MNSYRVLITARSFGSVSPKPYEILAAEGCEVVSNRYDRPLKAGELATIIRDVDAVIVGRDVVDAAAIEAANRLKVICMHGVGLDAIDVEAARRKGIVVTNLPGGNSDSVAELAIGMMFCLARRILAADKCTREGGWGRFIGTELAGKTLGLVGLGHIGRAVAVRARALRMSVIAYDVERDDDFARMNSITYATLDEVLVQSDFVSLHPDGEHQAHHRRRGHIEDEKLGISHQHQSRRHCGRGCPIRGAEEWSACRRSADATRSSHPP